MPYPNRQQIEIALLKVLVDLGGEARPRDTYARVAALFPQITAAELKARGPRSKYVMVWWNKVQWAKDNLKNDGCVAGTPTKTEGTWKITEKGRKRLQERAGELHSVKPDGSTRYLERFKAQAAEWFKRTTFVKSYYDFFQNFFKPDNLETAEWPDIQKIGEHLHCFQSMALAKGISNAKTRFPAFEGSCW